MEIDRSMFLRHKAIPLLSLIQAILVVRLVSSETVILDSHSRYDQSWDWLTTYELATGSGWGRSSQTGEYLVCDLPETATKSTNSWLISNFIDLQGAVSVTVQLEFTARQCDRQSLPFCKESFMLYVYQTDQRLISGVQKSTILAGHFTFAATIAPIHVWNSAQARITNKAAVGLTVQSKGLYLGFRDIGGCIALGKVQVVSNFCPGKIIGGASYNRTPSPPNGHAVKVNGNCAVNSESPHNANTLHMQCQSNGTWNRPASAATCLCKPGYQITSQGCQECPSGKFKPSLSNSECSSCPVNTNSNNSRQQCECNAGFYRGPKDKKEGKCTAPPSAARNLSIIFQDQSVIVVAWLPPLDNGGREDVVYDINCFQCDPGPRCRNKQLCGGKLEFWPVRFNNHFTHVTLTGLQPNTSYMLRVTAENGVSYLYGPSPRRNAEIQFGTRISAKMLLDKTYVDDTTAVLTWNSVDNPHEFSSYDRYEISCFKCDQGGDSVNHQCTESCGEKIRYWPGKEGLKDNHVTVSELEPSTLYKFVLYVWKYRTALSSVLIETSASTEVSQGGQFFNLPTIIALILAGILFIVAVIILLVTCHLRRRWYKIGKSVGSDNNGSNEGTYSIENTDNTIIMEEILQDIDHSTAGNQMR